MDIGSTHRAVDRAAWRAWLEHNHGTAMEIWLLLDDRPDEATVSYLDAVEEALCYGWIDSIAKRASEHERAQRFSPRRPRSNWTDPNQERARRLIRLGLMTDAGRAALPDLEAEPSVATDVIAALKAEPGAWEHFEAFPDLHRRVRIGYIEEQRRDPAEFERRLRSFIAKTADGRMFGNWNDGGRLG